MSEITHEQIDRAGRYLRETTQAGKKLTPWDLLPRTAKKKWLALAAGVLASAMGQPS